MCVNGASGKAAHRSLSILLLTCLFAASTVIRIFATISSFSCLLPFGLLIALVLFVLHSCL